MEERPAALEEFMAGLRQLRERAGEPSFRRMASKSGAISHATLHLTVTGYRLQPWETVREFVRACDGDEAEWHTRWRDTSLALSTEDKDENRVVGAPPRAWWRSSWLFASLAVVVAAVAVAVVMVVAPDEDPPTASPNTPLYPGDASRFITDVTIPDRTVVKPDSQFVKVWEIQNSGTVHWRDRYLQRIEPPIGPDDCRTPERIPINDTAPQQHVQITVTVRTPTTAPVDCKVRWKMVDESGQKLLPFLRPIYFEVWVRS